MPLTRARSARRKLDLVRAGELETEKLNKYDFYVCEHCGDGEDDNKASEQIQRFPLQQATLERFFHIKRGAAHLDSDNNAKRAAGSLVAATGGEVGGAVACCAAGRVTPTPKKRRRRAVPALSLPKKAGGSTLRAFRPVEDEERKLVLQASLATAIRHEGAEYSEELVYQDRAVEKANVASREGVQAIGATNMRALQKHKEQLAQGQWPPLHVRHDSVEGFVVEADASIPAMTLICEYTGDVSWANTFELDHSDCLMDLLILDHDKEHSLTISAAKRCNIARFISGVNNTVKELAAKQNVKCVRYEVDGQARVLLVALRTIREGERLYYNYNEFRQSYDTSYFV
eukprot:PRCOL_00000680-RA